MIRQTVLILVLAPFCFLGDRNDPASVYPVLSGTGTIVSHRVQTMAAEEFANRFGSAKSRGERANTKPTARFTMEPAGGVVGTVFTFDPTSSSDNESTIAWLSVRYDWENDGNYDTSWWNASQTIEYSYSVAGTKTVAMLLRDPEGLTDVATRTFQVADPGHNTPPVARCTITPASGPVSTTFTFSASGSSDSQDAAAALTARWDWYNSGYWSTPWQPISQSQPQQFDRHGSKTVRLRVRDSGLLSHDTTCTVEVVPEQPNTAPAARFTITPPTGDIRTLFTMDASGSSDVEDAIAWLSARYDWEDDGVYDTPWTNASQIIQHRFSAPGGYRVRLEIKDTGNKTDSTTRTLSVNAEPIHLPSIRRE